MESTLDIMDTFVAVDVEIASRLPMQICSIGAVRIDHGLEVDTYQALVACPKKVKFTKIHGYTNADLVGAPAWPTVWGSLMDFLRDAQLLVAFRASFDRAAILSMCARHGLRVPRLRFLCAAAVAEKHFGHRLTLHSALDLFDIPFPGTPHDALSDARAAAAVVLACGRAKQEPPQS